MVFSVSNVYFSYTFGFPTENDIVASSQLAQTGQGLLGVILISIFPFISLALHKTISSPASC